MVSRCSMLESFGMNPSRSPHWLGQPFGLSGWLGRREIDRLPRGWMGLGGGLVVWVCGPVAWAQDLPSSFNMLPPPPSTLFFGQPLPGGGSLGIAPGGGLSPALNGLTPLAASTMASPGLGIGAAGNPSASRYSVYVGGGSDLLLAQVQRVEPGAFRQEFEGRTVIQAGLFLTETAAKAQVDRLANQGILAAIELLENIPAAVGSDLPPQAVTSSLGGVGLPLTTGSLVNPGIGSNGVAIAAVPLSTNGGAIPALGTLPPVPGSFSPSGGASSGAFPDLTYTRPTLAATPSNTPLGATGLPSNFPTGLPGSFPTGLPGNFPTGLPSSFPTGLPSNFPTGLPSNLPTGLPGSFPTGLPSNFPTGLPSNLPTGLPGNFPTGLPGNFPTGLPSNFPTGLPSNLPTGLPTGLPGNFPTGLPGNFPTGLPSNLPTGLPGNFPTGLPGNFPTGFSPNLSPPSSVPFGSYPAPSLGNPGDLSRSPLGAKSYFVAIPTQAAALAEIYQVIAQTGVMSVAPIEPRNSRLGSFLAIGPFPDRANASLTELTLRTAGLRNARVYYGY